MPFQVLILTSSDRSVWFRLKLGRHMHAYHGYVMLVGFLMGSACSLWLASACGWLLACGCLPYVDISPGWLPALVGFAFRLLMHVCVVRCVVCVGACVRAMVALNKLKVSK